MNNGENGICIMDGVLFVKTSGEDEPEQWAVYNIKKVGDAVVEGKMFNYSLDLDDDKVGGRSIAGDAPNKKERMEVFEFIVGHVQNSVDRMRKRVSNLTKKMQNFL